MALDKESLDIQKPSNIDNHINYLKKREYGYLKWMIVDGTWFKVYRKAWNENDQ